MQLLFFTDIFGSGNTPLCFSLVSSSWTGAGDCFQLWGIKKGERQSERADQGHVHGHAEVSACKQRSCCHQRPIALSCGVDVWIGKMQMECDFWMNKLLYFNLRVVSLWQISIFLPWQNSGLGSRLGHFSFHSTLSCLHAVEYESHYLRLNVLRHWLFLLSANKMFFVAIYIWHKHYQEH